MPPRFRILLSPQAATDLQSIFDYIAQNSEQAPAFVARLLDAIQSLSIFPHRNVVLNRDPRLKHPVRSLPVQSYVIFFRVIEKEQTVRILRVRHGAQQRPKHF